MRRECDIDDGDGTGDLANTKNRESPGLNVETVTRVASGDSRDWRAGTRRGTAGTGGPHTRATTKHEEGDVTENQRASMTSGTWDTGTRGPALTRSGRTRT